MSVPDHFLDGKTDTFIETDLVEIRTLNNINVIHLSIKEGYSPNLDERGRDKDPDTGVYNTLSRLERQDDKPAGLLWTLDLATLDELIETLQYAAIMATTGTGSAVPNRLKIMRGGDGV